MAVFPVVLDANVLYGILSTDLLITTAGRGLFRAHWTAEILNEAKRNILANRPDLEPRAVGTRFEAMTQAMPEAFLEPPSPKLVAAMQNHPEDRHVLATAVSVGAEVIVTENIRHFTGVACQPHGIKALTLDEFVSDLVSLDHRQVLLAIEEMARRRQRPPMTTAQIWAQLGSYIPSSLAQLAAYQNLSCDR